MVKKGSPGSYRAKPDERIRSTEKERGLDETQDDQPEKRPEDARRITTKQQIRKARQYREMNLSVRRIADIMGIPRSTVHRITKDVVPFKPKVVTDTTSPDSKAMSEKELPSAVRQPQPVSGILETKQTLPQHQRLEDTIGPLSPEFEGLPFSSLEPQTARWKRIKLTLYAKALEGKWDNIEDYLEGEFFPKIRYAEAFQEFVIPFVRKMDARGNPDQDELLRLSLEIMEQGLVRFLARTRTVGSRFGN